MFDIRRRLVAVTLAVVLALAAIMPAAATSQNFYPTSGSCTASGVGSAWTSGTKYLSSSVTEYSCGTNVAARVEAYLGGGNWWIGGWNIQLTYANQTYANPSLVSGYAFGQLRTSGGWGLPASTGLLYP